MENLDCCRIIIKGIECIKNFVQIHRNDKVDAFFVENSYKIYLKVIIKFLTIETAID